MRAKGTTALAPRTAKNVGSASRSVHHTALGHTLTPQLRSTTSTRRPVRHAVSAISEPPRHTGSRTAPTTPEKRLARGKEQGRHRELGTSTRSAAAPARRIPTPRATEWVPSDRSVVLGLLAVFFVTLTSALFLITAVRKRQSPMPLTVSQRTVVPMKQPRGLNASDSLGYSASAASVGTLRKNNGTTATLRDEETEGDQDAQSEDKD